VRALSTVSDIEVDAEDAEQAKFLKARREFSTYLRANADSIPNYEAHMYKNRGRVSGVAELACTPGRSRPRIWR